MSPQTPFSHQYNNLLEAALSTTSVRYNQRTGAAIHELPATCLTADLSRGLLPMVNNRRTYPRSAAAEVAWFLSGSRDIQFIAGYAPLWNDFVEDDGKTVQAAYGYRWRRHFGRDQIAEAVAALSKDPTTRRVWVSAWDPGQDGLAATGQRNVPCPVGFTLSLNTDMQLESTLFIRSSDVFVGLPYDVMGHAMLMAILANSIPHANGCGVMTITLAQPHLYGVHVSMAENSLFFLRQQQFPPRPVCLLSAHKLTDVEKDPHGFVAHYASQFDPKGYDFPAYRPEIVK